MTIFRALWRKKQTEGLLVLAYQHPYPELCETDAELWLGALNEALVMLRQHLSPFDDESDYELISIERRSNGEI